MARTSSPEQDPGARLLTNLRKISHCPEKTPTRVFSLLKVLASAELCWKCTSTELCSTILLKTLWWPAEACRPVPPCLVWGRPRRGSAGGCGPPPPCPPGGRSHCPAITRSLLGSIMTANWMVCWYMSVCACDTPSTSFYCLTTVSLSPLWRICLLNSKKIQNIFLV